MRVGDEPKVECIDCRGTGILRYLKSGFPVECGLCGGTGNIRGHMYEVLDRLFDLEEKLNELRQLVDQTDPDCPIGVALTRVGLHQ